MYRDIRRLWRGCCRPAGSWLRAVAVCLGLAWLMSASAAGVSRGADESYEQRKARLEGLSDTDKLGLLENQRRFQELPLTEQERLHRFHQQLAADPDRDQLQGVLTRYYNWLRSLTPPERAELVSLPAEKRLARIRELIHAQDTRRFRMMAGGFMMSHQDLTAIQAWFDQFLDEHAEAILATLPDEQFARLKQDYDPDRDRNLLRFVYFRHPSPALPHPSREDVARLETLVSKPAREVLAQADEPEQTRIIQRWVGAAALSQMRTNPSMEELQQFAQESLSNAERFRLESLPRDRMYRELRMLYNQRRFGGDPRYGFPRFPRPDGGAWSPPPPPSPPPSSLPPSPPPPPPHDDRPGAPPPP